jgi:hypothetical protein
LIFAKFDQIYPALFVISSNSLNRSNNDQWSQPETVADMPSLEVESSPAGTACCKTCSKDHAAHGNGGVFYFNAEGGINARRLAGLFVLGKFLAQC